MVLFGVVFGVLVLALEFHWRIASLIIESKVGLGEAIISKFGIKWIGARLLELLKRRFRRELELVPIVGSRLPGNFDENFLVEVVDNFQIVESIIPFESCLERLLEQSVEIER